MGFNDLMHIDPMTFIDKLDPYFPGDIPDVQMWTSYVKALESYRLTDEQTDRQTQRKLYTWLLREW